MNGRFADELADFYPKSWLTRFRHTSPWYLVKMLLFYHGIGFLLLLVGTYLIEGLYPNSEEPRIPRSLVGVLAAGPLEETIFFGIPFYVLGSPFSMLVTGSIWA